jgi:ADP-ribose pyrophosphatase
LVVEDGAQLVVIRQRRPGSSGFVTELPGGTRQGNESAVETADRELAEECGLAVRHWTALGDFWVAPAYSTERVTVMYGVVSGPAKPSQHDDDEEIVTDRVPVAEARDVVEDAVSLAALALWDATEQGTRPGLRTRPAW